MPLASSPADTPSRKVRGRAGYGLLGEEGKEGKGVGGGKMVGCVL